MRSTIDRIQDWADSAPHRSIFVAGFGGCLVGAALVALLAFPDDVQLGNLADAAAALFTGGAFFAGFRVLDQQRKANNLAAKTLRENQKTLRVERDAARRRQAARVSAVVRSEVRDRKTVWFARVKNSSDAPVFQAKAAYQDADGQMIPFGSPQDVPVGEEIEIPLEADPMPLVVSVGFTNSEGLHWIRTGGGELVPVPIPPGEGGRLVFEIARSWGHQQMAERWHENMALFDLYDEDVQTSAQPEWTTGVRRTYRVECFNDGEWWPVRVLDVAGETYHTQATDLDEVSVMARDLISSVLEVPENTFEIDVAVVNPWLDE